MSDRDSASASATLLSIAGEAADHLYREGSAKAGFWEVLFGSRLAPEKRTRISTLADGARRFDVPTLSLQPAILESLRSWGAAQPESAATRALGDALDAGALVVTLVGLQPRGVAIATFALALAPREGKVVAPGLAETLAAWWAAEGPRLRRALVDFGFTPRPV